MRKRALFIFRRDLRLEDNVGLNYAARNYEQVIPLFIFNPLQLNDHQYRSTSGLQFLFESLEDLQRSITKQGGTLYFYHGSITETLPRIFSKFSPDAVVFNKDYTPFSKMRDEQIATFCKHNASDCVSFDDALLFAPGFIVKQDKKPYTVYTPFANAALKQDVPRPVTPNEFRFFKESSTTNEVTLEDMRQRYLPQTNERLRERGGRSEGQSILKNLAQYGNYAATRDFPALSSTTGLSAHNKFGTLSPREVFYAIEGTLGRGHTLIKELLWREFFITIAFFFPHVFAGAFYQRYDALEWNTSPDHFAAWQSGETGFPIVDAGMRELKQTGFMHNRIRMIVASFLTKDLHISWREGEKHFARYLVDYDPAVNNGNWQWAASTGCDAQPYFRIFNPWLQQKKFDVDCLYIKKWVPELMSVSPKDIHSLYLRRPQSLSYPAPIVDHAEEKSITERRYSEAANASSISKSVRSLKKRSD